MHNYAGNPAVYPANVGLIDDADLNPATASALDVAPQNLADRTAYLAATKLSLTGGLVTGNVTFGGTAELIIGASAMMTVVAGGDIDVAGEERFLSGSFCEFLAGSTLTLDPAATVSGTLNGGPLFLKGIVLSTTGAVQATHDQAIEANVTGAVSANAVGGVKSTVVGGIQFGGGPTDFGSFDSARTKRYSFPLQVMNPRQVDGANWDAGPVGLIGLNVAAASLISLILVNPHEGALLSQVIMTFVVTNAHASVPTAPPILSVERVHLNTGGAVSIDKLSTVDPQSPFAPASGAAWYDGGVMQQWAYNCNQNNVIDNTNYTYFVLLGNEWGAGAVAGNFYYALTAVYSNITDLQFAS